MPQKHSYLTVTDQFCGAGGSSIGAVKAGAEVKLAMNHWKLAIETHNTNFPNVDHDCADMSAVDPRRYASTDILITSPECTNHSLAKGIPRRLYTRDLFGTVLIDPAQERSRATMWDVPRFAEFHKYRLIVVENVVEAAKWRLFPVWLDAMAALDYEHEVVYYNSMFAHPTPQSRDRMYVVFWKKGNRRPNLDFRPPAHCGNCQKIVGAIQTWKKRLKWGRYKAQYYYRCPECHREITPYYFAAFNAIDWSIPAERIGDRKRPLKPKTLARIAYGLEKYGRKPLVITGRYTSGVACRVKDASAEPLPTQPGDSSHAVVLPWMVQTDFSKGNGQYVKDSVDPIATQSTRESIGVALPWMVETAYTHSGDNRVDSIIDPMNTQSTRQTIGVAGFLSKQYGGGADPKHMSIPLDGPTGAVTCWDHHALIGLAGGQIVSVNDFDPRTLPVDGPLGVQTTQDKWALASPGFIVQQNDNGKSSLNSRSISIDDPIKTITANDNHAIAGFPPSFIANLRGGGSIASGIDDQLMCVTQTGCHHALLSSQAFLTYYYGTHQAGGISDPLHTVTGIDRAGLVGILENLTLDDLTFRMLVPKEIGVAMAFPKSYIVLGTNREQTRQYGGAVTPPVMEMILKRCVESFA